MCEEEYLLLNWKTFRENSWLQTYKFKLLPVIKAICVKYKFHFKFVEKYVYIFL